MLRKVLILIKCIVKGHEMKSEGVVWLSDWKQDYKASNGLRTFVEENAYEVLRCKKCKKVVYIELNQSRVIHTLTTCHNR